MTTRESDRLKEVIGTVANRARKQKGRGLGEQNTKASLIDPILEALGWDIREPDEVHREYKPTSRDSPVDYALKLIRKPRLFVEAKGLDENLSDRKWISQVLGYATVAGVEWCVLTDGDEYRIYNATAALDADDKLFCSLRLSESDPAHAVETLNLISRGNMEENILDVLWIAHFVDRQVREALRGILETPNKRLVRLIRSIAPKLSPKEIVESIRRLEIRIGPSPALPELAAGSGARSIVGDGKPSDDRSAAAKRAWETRRSGSSAGPKSAKSKTEVGKRKKTRTPIPATLAEIIDAGFLNPPLRLFRKYKGTVLEAKLLSNGTVEFQGTAYPSCSTAAELARGTITGRRMNTNGWGFWQYTERDGKTFTLTDARARYILAHATKAK